MIDDEPETIEPDEVDEVKWWEPIDAVIFGPFTRYDENNINCSIVHPTYGHIPFTASRYDEEELGRTAYDYAASQIGG